MSGVPEDIFVRLEAIDSISECSAADVQVDY